MDQGNGRSPALDGAEGKATQKGFTCINHTYFACGIDDGLKSGEVALDGVEERWEATLRRILLYLHRTERMMGLRRAKVDGSTKVRSLRNGGGTVRCGKTVRGGNNQWWPASALYIRNAGCNPGV